MARRDASTADNSVQKRRFLSPALAVPIALFLLALGVRIIGLTWGLPSEQRWYSYHPDERDIAASVFRLDFFSGDFNPNFYNYPSLFIYLTYLAHLLSSTLGLTHQVRPDSTAVWPFLYDVLLAGRTLSALFGAAAVPLVYSIAKRAAGNGVGVLAALFLAFVPGHVQHSHFATVDVPATFFITLSLWLAVRALDGARDDTTRNWQTKQLLLAAGAAGLAAATKYNAGLVIVAPILALFQLRQTSSGWRKYSLKAATAIIGAAVLSFVVGCPGSILYTREFLGTGKYMGVLYELFVHSREGSGDIFVGSGHGWWYHLTFNLPFLMTWPLLLAALLGLACSVSTFRRRSSLEDGHETGTLPRSVLLILLVWFAIYFLTTGLSQVRFMRYMLPLAPTLCVFAAVGVLRRPTKAIATPPFSLIQKAAAIIILLVAVTGTCNVLYSFVATDPRDEAAAFLQKVSASSTTVGLTEPPWFWSPPLTPQDAPPPRFQEPASTSPDGHYHFLFTGFDAARLRQEQPEWFVLSEFEWREKERLHSQEYAAFTEALKGRYDSVKSFKHQPPASLPGREFVPHDFLYTNPEVRIYHRRSTQ